MQLYNIKKGVYIVDGIRKASIYDCNSDKHYWVDKDVSQFFHRLTERKLTADDEDTLSGALELSLIEETDQLSVRQWYDMKELFNFARHIDYAWIELTNQCNLRCTHCYNETEQRMKKNLSYDEFVHVADELVRFGIKAVQLIGGEPFVLKEDILFKMMDYASKSFNEFEVFFNGTLTNRQHIERIKRDYPNCKIAMSLHSFIREEHEKITQVKNSFDKSVQTLHNLKDLGMKFRYVGIYAADIEIGEELDFGVPYRRDYIRLTGRGNLSHYDSDLLSKKLITLDTFKFNDLKETLKSTYSECCFANYLYVGSNMNVYPCVMERRMCHGNLRNKALSEILDHTLINYSKENVKECRGCEFRHLCKDCRPDSISMKIDDKPWYCTYDVANGVWMDKDAFIDNLLNP
jgi:radical SAM protein with 4Fe4S-binding SPASM domain